jgi:hypothetical protein
VQVTGDLSKRAQINSNDEVGTTSKSFNELLGSLQSALKNIHDRVDKVNSAATFQSKLKWFPAELGKKMQLPMRLIRRQSVCGNSLLLCKAPLGDSRYSICLLKGVGTKLREKAAMCYAAPSD